MSMDVKEVNKVVFLTILTQQLYDLLLRVCNTFTCVIPFHSSYIFKNILIKKPFIWYWPYVWNWLINYVWHAYCWAYSKYILMVIFFSQEECFYLMTNFPIRFQVMKAAFDSVLKSSEFQLNSLKTQVWFCSVNMKITSNKFKVHGGDWTWWVLLITVDTRLPAEGSYNHLILSIY